MQVKLSFETVWYRQILKKKKKLAKLFDILGLGGMGTV